MNNTVIDVGNTRVKVGSFIAGKLVNADFFSLQNWQNLYTFFSGKEIGNCILSSTVPIPTHILQYLKSKAAQFLLLDENTALPISNIYKTKNTLGKDRLALAVGAAHIYPIQKMLVVNAGTCVTYNILNDKSEFVGGAISPGLQMRLQAMNTFTAQLPLAEIKPDAEVKLIGESTEESLLSGAVNGLVFEIQGFIAQTEKDYFPLKVILSGGDSRYLAEHLHQYNSTQKIHTEPNLALNGLNQILHFNVEK